MDWKKAHTTGAVRGEKAKKGGRVVLKGGKRQKRGFNAMVKRHIKKALEANTNEGSDG